MKPIPLSLAALFLAPAALHAQATAARDPAIAVWRLEDGRQIRIRDNRTIIMWTPGKTGSIEGKWEADPFAEGIRRYQVDWQNGRVWTIEMSKDGEMLRSTSPEGEKTTSHKLEELTAYLQCNDAGGLDVNGVRMIDTPKAGKEERLYVRSGDILTMTVARKKGQAAFALEIFRGNASIISARNFLYTAAPAPDWKKTKDTTGYRPVDTIKMRELALGNIIGPLAATAKGADEKFGRLYFKYVIP